MRRAPLEGAQREPKEGAPHPNVPLDSPPSLPARSRLQREPAEGTEVGPGETGDMCVGGARSRGLRVRIQGRTRDPGGVSAHGYLEGCERSARSSLGYPAAAPHTPRGAGDHWDPLDRGFRAPAHRRVRAVLPAAWLPAAGLGQGRTQSGPGRLVSSISMAGRLAEQVGRGSGQRARAGRLAAREGSGAALQRSAICCVCSPGSPWALPERGDGGRNRGWCAPALRWGI